MHTDSGGFEDWNADEAAEEMLRYENSRTPAEWAAQEAAWGAADEAKDKQRRQAPWSVENPHGRLPSTTSTLLGGFEDWNADEAAAEMRRNPHGRRAAHSATPVATDSSAVGGDGWGPGGFNPNPELAESIRNLPAAHKPLSVLDGVEREKAIALEEAREADMQAAAAQEEVDMQEAMFDEQADGSNVSPRWTAEAAARKAEGDIRLAQGQAAMLAERDAGGNWLQKILGTSGGKDFLRADNPAAWGAGAAGVGLGGLALSNAMGNDDEEEEEEEEARRIGLGL